jgi:hypothetical protein
MIIFILFCLTIQGTCGAICVTLLWREIIRQRILIVNMNAELARILGPSMSVYAMRPREGIGRSIQ